jgi:D-cysteine desulfhydrase/L-cysteate sulfo-lyase
VPARTAAIANEAAGTLGLDVTVRPEDVVNFDDFVGPGYGQPSAEGKEAVRLFARTEALVLDPVYTGKCAAALIAHARTGRLTRDDTAVFVHTGGAPAIFTWSHLWTDEGAPAPDARS